MSNSVLSAPIETLLDNCEYELEDKQVLIGWMEGGNQGFNAKTIAISNLLEDGIIDPTLVTKSSVSAAFSIAMMFLTTDVAVLLE